MSLQWKDNWIRLLALFMAVLLWFYVSNEQNPVTDLTYNNVPLTVRDQPPGYVLEGVPETVNLRVKGGRNTIGMLQRQDFNAYIRIPPDVAPGQLTLPVQVVPPPGVEVTKITPREVQVQVDQIITKNIPVVVNLTGDPAPGLQRGEPVSRPSQVQVQGPSNILKRKHEVSVNVDVTGASDTLERQVALVVRSKGVTVQPQQVTVTVPITNMPSRNLPVRVNMAGVPAQGFLVDSVTVNPATVQVTGRESTLQGLTAVNTSVLDISGLSEDVEREVGLELPAGTSLVGTQQVLVTVRIKPVEETRPVPNDNGNNDETGGGEEESE